MNIEISDSRWETETRVPGSRRHESVKMKYNCICKCNFKRGETFIKRTKTELRSSLNVSDFRGFTCV